MSREPFSRHVSPRIVRRRMDFPHPTGPTIMTSVDRSIVRLTSFNRVLPALRMATVADLISSTLSGSNSPRSMLCMLSDCESTKPLFSSTTGVLSLRSGRMFLGSTLSSRSRYSCTRLKQAAFAPSFGQHWIMLLRGVDSKATRTRVGKRVTALKPEDQVVQKRPPATTIVGVKAK